MRFVLLAAAALAFAAGCPPEPKPPDEGQPVGDTNACQAAYEQARTLGCPPAPPARGTWVDACKNAAAHGIDLHTACRREAKSCADEAVCDRN